MVFVSGKIQKTIKQSRVRTDVIWPIHAFHVKNVKFECLNLLLKHEKGKIFREVIIFYSIEFFISLWQIGNAASPITLSWLPTDDDAWRSLTIIQAYLVSLRLRWAQKDKALYCSWQSVENLNDLFSIYFFCFVFIFEVCTTVGERKWPDNCDCTVLAILYIGRSVTCFKRKHVW